MEIPAMSDEKQKENQAKPAAEDVISEKASVVNRATGGHAKLARKDPHAAQKLARKKRLRAAHRRRLKASSAKG